MQQTKAERKTATGPIFHDLAERLRKRGIVLIFSDLFDNVENMLAGLKHFRHRRHEVMKGRYYVTPLVTSEALSPLFGTVGSAAFRE